MDRLQKTSESVHHHLAKNKHINPLKVQDIITDSTLIHTY